MGTVTNEVACARFAVVAGCQVREMGEVIGMSNDRVVQVEVRDMGDTSQLILWSYGYRAQYSNYKRKPSNESSTDDLYQFMKTCAGLYVAFDLGLDGARLVSGPNQIGEGRYILVFRSNFEDDKHEFVIDPVAHVRR
jgi:hypothetical protein